MLFGVHPLERTDVMPFNWPSVRRVPLALHESGSGTFRTCRHVRPMSAIEGKTDRKYVLCSRRHEWICLFAASFLTNELHQSLGIDHGDAAPFEVYPPTLLPSSQLLVGTLA
jgi:hypothetical protein